MLSIVLYFFCFVSSDSPYWPESFLTTLGRSEYDSGRSVQQTADGGFIVAGSTESFEAEGADVLLAKYFPNGTLEWASTLGGSHDERGFSVKQTTDGGFIVTGYTGFNYVDNVLLAKYFPNGTLEWSSTLDGGDDDEGSSVQQTVDDGFIVTGFTTSFGAGNADVLLAKYFPNGTLEWVSTLGGDDDDKGSSVEQTTDGGFIVAGSTKSFGSGNTDVLLIKLFPNGSLEWSSTFSGGDANDVFGYYSVKQTTDGGFIGAGYSTFGTGSSNVLLAKYKPSGTLEWVSTFGGSSQQTGYSVQETTDGGFIVAGNTVSFGWGFSSVLLAKYFPNGTLEWASALGGIGFEHGESIQETTDGGFIVTGNTIGSFGVGSGVHVDVLLIKTDKNGEGLFDEECPANWARIPSTENSKFIAGDISAERIIDFNFTRQYNFILDFVSPNFSFVSNVGGVLDGDLEHCSVIRECFGVRVSLVDDILMNDSSCSNHGGCVDFDKCECNEPYKGVNCEISYCDGLISNDTEVCGGHGECSDINVCDCDGDYFGDFCDARQFSSFSRTFGENGNDYGRSVQQTADGGFIVAGSTENFGAEGVDVLLAKYFPNGTLEWASTLGGSHDERGFSVEQTVDDGFIVTGSTKSFGDGKADVLLVKYFPNGTLEWSSTLGGDDDDEGSSVQQTIDGGFIVAGSTESFGSGDGDRDILLAKYFSNGTLEWISTLGGSDHDEGSSVRQTIDGGFIVAGFSKSFGSEDGYRDIILAKYFPDGTSEWVSTLGGSHDDYGYSVQQTKHGGYILTGCTGSFGSGAVEWVSTIRGNGVDYGYSVQETTDGGFVVSGSTQSFGSGSTTSLVVKYLSSGVLEWISTLGEGWGYSIQQTMDEGFIVAGGSAEGDVFLSKVNNEGKSCDYSAVMGVSSDYVYNYQYGMIGISAEDHSDDFTFSYISPNVSKIVLGLDTKICTSEFECFGVIDDESMCNLHGDCRGYDRCECDEDYYGDECEINSCFGILGNDSNLVCSGHGDCVDYDKCECFSNYTLAKNCSMWQCFGKWKNDSTVCNGVKGVMMFGLDPMDRSFGICVSHDTCYCTIEGYQESSGCDWDCFGDANYEQKACNGEYGVCIDHDICNCTRLDVYSGGKCLTPTCASIVGSDLENVCSGHGECEEPDICDCDAGYFSSTPGQCDWWNCEGIHWKDEDSVCHGNGKCKEFNFCECKNGYEGTYCDTWKCGDIDKDDISQVCSGKGTCVVPKKCDCKPGFKGSVCETNTLLATVMAPILSVSGLLALVLFLVVLCLCGFCFLLVFCVCTVLLGVLMVYIGTQAFRWRKFKRVKNIDMILNEQDAEDNTSIAHIRINKKLFEIPYEEIKVVRILGEGGSASTVFLAKWRNRKIAFKCFKTRMLCVSQDSFNEFEKEVEVFASISHPNVVTFYGCSMKPPRVGILMEFCENGECHQYIRKYEETNDGVRYPMTERFRMLFEVSGAMSYLHSRNIVHRDLKCENVLLDKNEECKVMDFGLAKISDRISKNVTKKIGTSFYSLSFSNFSLAPEVVNGVGRYNEKCDVFSFSIMCWILVTGDDMPYGKDSKQLNIELRVSQDPKFRPDVKHMKRFLREEEMWIIEQTQKCWNSDPQKRPSFSELNMIFEEGNERGGKAGRELGRKQMQIQTGVTGEALKSDGDSDSVEIDEKNNEDDVLRKINFSEFEKVKKERDELKESLKEILCRKELSDGERVRIMKENYL